MIAVGSMAAGLVEVMTTLSTLPPRALKPHANATIGNIISNHNIFLLVLFGFMGSIHTFYVDLLFEIPQLLTESFQLAGIFYVDDINRQDEMDLSYWLQQDIDIVQYLTLKSY